MDASARIRLLPEKLAHAEPQDHIPLRRVTLTIASALPSGDSDFIGGGARRRRSIPSAAAHPDRRALTAATPPQTQ
jgi:hypothetical protein